MPACSGPRPTKLRVQCVTRCDFHPRPRKGNCTMMNNYYWESGGNFRTLKFTSNQKRIHKVVCHMLTRIRIWAPCERFGGTHRKWGPIKAWAHQSAYKRSRKHHGATQNRPRQVTPRLYSLNAQSGGATWPCHGNCNTCLTSNRTCQLVAP